jgi:hypothetical protein
MRNSLTSFFTCSSLIIAAAITPRNAKSMPAADGSLKMTVMSGRPVVDGVYLNGHGPFRFLIDTGAETNQVEASIARKIGLAPTFRVDMATIAGTIPVAGGKVDEVALGQVTAAGQEFLFTGLDGVHQLSSGIQGVIGQEFLSRFDYLLDFAGGRIVFGGAEPDCGSRTAFTLVEGRPAVETDWGKLVLDSGTATAILYADSTGKSGGRVVTASGRAVVSETHDLRLRVGGRAYSTVAASAPREALEEDGIVPASLFHAVYVSNSGRYLVLNPGTQSNPDALGNACRKGRRIL